jgi:hypothetical protein
MTQQVHKCEHVPLQVASVVPWFQNAWGVDLVALVFWGARGTAQAAETASREYLQRLLCRGRRIVVSY